MRLTIRTKLVATFSLTLCLLTIAVAVVGWRVTITSSTRFEDLFERNLKATVHLAEAQDALWRLRYGFPQFIVLNNPEDRKKIIDAEPSLYAIVDQSIKAYTEYASTPAEREGLQEWTDAWAKYVGARPRWFELYGAGKLQEAAEWRARTTTPYGAASVNALAKLVSLQRTASGQGHRAEVQNSQFLGALTLGAIVVLAMGLGVGLIFAISRKLTGPLATAVGVLEAVAKGDFTRRLEVRSVDEMGRMATALNQAVDSVRTALGEVHVSAQQSALASQEVAEAAHQLAGRAQEQASSLEETAASLEEMGASVKQNADSAAQANRLALDARTVAEKGGHVVASAVSAMSEINTASTRIADIIGAIDAIAFQTNLLALNAAVEAARAGEQGRGFAVVATEVRNLAQRSAEAAREIKSLIQDTVRKVEAGATLVNQSGQTLQEIVDAVKRVADIVTEIAAAGREQASGIDQVNRAVTLMDQLTQSNAAQTEELSSTAQALAVQAEQLQALVARFVLERADAASRPESMTLSALAPSAMVPPAVAALRSGGARTVGRPPVMTAGRPLAIATTRRNGPSETDDFVEF
jgi:methyl-accepting chemotaxis protein